MKKIIVIPFLIMMASVGNAQQMSHSDNKNATSFKLQKSLKYQELNKAMRELWSAHMYWTLLTVDAFYNDPKGIDAKLSRLMQNQRDIGMSVVPFYGEAAGDKLSELLTKHIEGAIPVLQAAKNNNKEALDKAVKDWYTNAKEIGDFLASANPKNWAPKETGSVLEMHITHTIAYAVNMLKNDYSRSFAGFEEALRHMLHLADILSDGIAKQFPEKF